VLTVQECSEAWECGLGSAQSTGMQESAGERRRVQVSCWKLRKSGFHWPGREQAYHRSSPCSTQSQFRTLDLTYIASPFTNYHTRSPKMYYHYDNPCTRPAAMPSPCSEYALYYSGHVNLFEDFLEEFEGQACDCKLTDPQ